MLARRSNLKVGLRNIDTPLLVPSFSSKAVVDSNAALQASEEYLFESFLVSAYDVHYKYIDAPDYEYSEIVFLDSGGYEAAKIAEVSELGYIPSTPKEWDESNHRKVLSAWPDDIPTIAVSYDHPNHRVELSEQITAAQELHSEFPHLVS